jgi:hypothetical protein
MARQFIAVTMRGTALADRVVIVSTYMIRDVIPANPGGSTIRCKFGIPDYPIQESVGELVPLLIDPPEDMSQSKSPAWQCPRCGHGESYPGSRSMKGWWYRRCALCHHEDRPSVTNEPPQNPDA